jgi:recombinational DNA repair protein RecT
VVEEVMEMRTSTKKVADMTIDELKSVIHEVIIEDMGAWRETFEIMADKKLMRQIKQADLDWASDAKDSYVSWDDLKNV